MSENILLIVPLAGVADAREVVYAITGVREPDSFSTPMSDDGGVTETHRIANYAPSDRSDHLKAVMDAGTIANPPADADMDVVASVLSTYDRRTAAQDGDAWNLTKMVAREGPDPQAALAAASLSNYGTAVV